MEAQKDLQQHVVKIISEIVPVKRADITANQRLREDLGMDSVASMELLSMLAEELGLDVGVEDVAHVRTVQDTVDLAHHFSLKKRPV